MKNIRVSAVQMNALIDDLEYNLEVHHKHITKAAENNCDLVLFPEISTTSHYGGEDVVRFAEEAGRGPVYDSIQKLARKCSIHVSYGFCEKAHGTYYNSQALLGPRGLIGIQRKVHASGDEYFSFRMGRSFHVYDIGKCRIGTLICYDSAFSESWRILALKGAEVILLPHAGRAGGVEKDVPTEEQLIIQEKRLNDRPPVYGTYTRENGVYGVFCNQYGFNGHSTHNGGIFILDPKGTSIAKSKPTLEDISVQADLMADTLEEVRKGKGFTLKTRRPEVYQEITEMI